MKLASFGAIQISVTPKADNAEILSVDIGTENRKEAVHMETNKDETVDQFCQRLRSMLRSLWNGEARTVAGTGKVEKTVEKEQTWDEQKAAMKNKAGAAAPASTEAKSTEAKK